MNTKIEFLKCAAEHCTDDTLLWIDFGIFKILKKPEECIATLRELSTLSFRYIVIPGCKSPSVCSCDSVNWRFCGGFLIMPRIHLPTFYGHSKNVLSSFCDDRQYKLTWEVNIWSVIEQCTNRENIHWYYAGHEDTIILNIKDDLTTCIQEP